MAIKAAVKANARAIPLLDLTRQYQPLREPIQAALARVIESQRFILGSEVERFEKRFAEYCGAQYAIGCASGTDALELALMAANIVPADEVLTVPFTFFATAGAILSAGARPVFVDVEPDSFNLMSGNWSTRSRRIPPSKPFCRCIYTAAARIWVRSWTAPRPTAFR